MRRLLATVALSLALPVSAAAQTPAPTAPAIALRVTSGLHQGRALFVLAGQPLPVAGSVTPYGAGQTVTVELRRGRALVERRTAAVHGGRFKATLVPRRGGNYGVVAVTQATATQAAAKSSVVAFGALNPSAGPGSRGVAVRLVQRQLARLGYPSPQNGSYDGATGLAMLAFRSVNGMSRTEGADRRVFRELFRGKGGFRLKYPRAGRHVEFDFSRQVVVLADHGRAQHIYHASSGKPSTPTVFGTFRFYRKDPGTNSLGMFDSNYFIAGYAIHGYPSVPTYPASHGCIRVPLSDAAFIFSRISIGERIFVYR